MKLWALTGVAPDTAAAPISPRARHEFVRQSTTSPHDALTAVAVIVLA